MALHNVGLVVIGRNEGERLVRCLTSLRASGCKTVYVDSGSTDGSLTTAEKFGAFVCTLEPDLPFTAARARNAGAKCIESFSPAIQFIQFIDGDCVLDGDWLEKARAFLSANARVAVVCGRRREMFPAASVYNRFMDLEWDRPPGEIEACGGDAMVRREAFDAVGGFNPAILAGEEPEFCFRLRQRNWAIWRIDAEMTLHDAAMRRFSQWWKRTTRAGYGCAQLWAMHGSAVNSGVAGQLRRNIIWSLLGPAALLGAAVTSKWCLALLLAYPAQIVRMSLFPTVKASDRWAYSTIMTTSQIAGFQGICKYFWYATIGLIAPSADYK